MSSIVSARITARANWAPGLMTVTLDLAAEFTPGQFFNLGLSLGDNLVRRSYSAASAPGEPLQFLLSEVATGQLTPRLFALDVGHSLLLDTKGLGFFTLNEVPETKRLWLVATGTGLGPYLSMLSAGVLQDRFERVIVVHGVRRPGQLAHRADLEAFAQRHPWLSYVPVLSGKSSDPEPGVPGRITQAWDDGALEALAGPFDRDCHMLLCGNPAMIEDMSARLGARGFEKHRRRQPGHYNFEKYW